MGLDEAVLVEKENGGGLEMKKSREPSLTAPLCFSSCAGK
jgi:hypothetical protein